MRAGREQHPCSGETWLHSDVSLLAVRSIKIVNSLNGLRTEPQFCILLVLASAVLNRCRSAVQCWTRFCECKNGRIGHLMEAACNGSILVPRSNDGGELMRTSQYLTASLLLAITVICGCHKELPPAATQPGNAVPSHEAIKPTRDAVEKHQPSAFHFTDRTASTGVNFIYRNGEESGHVSILESLGGGVAIFDFDLDSQDDLYFTGGGEFVGEGQVRGLAGGLYRNLGDWHFSEVASPALLNQPRQYSHGASAADFDNDGISDLLVTGYGGLQLWRNQGDGTFSEVTAVAGLNDKLWSSSAAWGDLNGDGSLDLYVAHYVDWSFDNHPYCEGPRPALRESCPPRMFSPLPDTLYLGNGDGTFRDESDTSGLRNDGKGLGVLLCDLDLDGDLDVYVANDTVENHLYENVGQGTLKDVSLLSGASLSDRGVPDGSMGIDVFDYNLDGLPDLWVSNYESENCALYQNTKRLLFRHVSQATGITAVSGMYVSWGTCCFDIDRDGDEDVFVANGHVIRYPKNAPLLQSSLLFENLGGRRLRNIAAESGEYTSTPHMARGAATGDFDGDGDLDLAVSHINAPAAILENKSESSGRWLAVSLIGTISPRDAIGAIVWLKTSEGRQMRLWKGGGSYASTSTRHLFFGLGSTAEVLEIEIRWPSGVQQVIAIPPVNHVLRVIERQPTR